jgi:hypothetical protein
MESYMQQHLKSNFCYQCQEKALTSLRGKTEVFLLLVTTEEASALSLVMQSTDAVPTR